MYEIKMPKAGQSMEDGTVVRWLKAEGQAVRQGEVLLEIETDKATIEVEAAHDGTLRKILCPEGTTVPIHTVIGLVAGPNEDVPGPLPESDLKHTSRPSAEPASAGFVSLNSPGLEAGVGARPLPSPLPPQEDACQRNDLGCGGRGWGGGPPKPTAKAWESRAGIPDLHGVIPVLMPKAGQSMEEGTILAWHVKCGDPVRKGEVIFEVETDKATIEVEAIDSGRLARIVVAEGTTVEVLTPVAYLADDAAAVDAFIAVHGAGGAAAGQTTAADDSAASAASHVSATASREAAATAQTSDSIAAGAVKASPAARKAARQIGLDLRVIGRGRGPGGRILSDDVLASAADVSKAAAHTPAADFSSPSGRPAAGKTIRRPMSAMRKAIARNVSASKSTIPHFYMRLTIDAEPLYEFYKAQKARCNCTLNDVVVLACARAIREFPEFRSRIDKGEVVEFPEANIGIAVGLEGGLVVPVVAGADAMTLGELAQESRRVVESARAGKIEGIGQGVFTITNLGMFGIEDFSAIINPPEAAILAVGAIRRQPVVRDGAVRAGQVMTLTLSADHRVIDGLLAARFLGRLKEFLEAPTVLAE